MYIHSNRYIFIEKEHFTKGITNVRYDIRKNTLHKYKNVIKSQRLYIGKWPVHSAYAEHNDN